MSSSLSDIRKSEWLERATMPSLPAMRQKRWDRIFNRVLRSHSSSTDFETSRPLSFTHSTAWRTPAGALASRLLSASLKPVAFSRPDPGSVCNAVSSSLWLSLSIRSIRVTSDDSWSDTLSELMYDRVTWRVSTCIIRTMTRLLSITRADTAPLTEPSRSMAPTDTMPDRNDIANARLALKNRWNMTATAGSRRVGIAPLMSIEAM